MSYNRLQTMRDNIEAIRLVLSLGVAGRTAQTAEEIAVLYNRENETCNFPKRNEQNFSFFASFFLLVFRPFKHQLNAD